MKDIVWVWLSACMAVVEGGSNPTEAYLNSRGDPTRKLSHPETQLLPRPGPGGYDADHQLLVPLAVTYALPPEIENLSPKVEELLG